MSIGTEIENIFNELKAKRVVKTQDDFAKLLSANRSSISRAMHDDPKYATDSLLYRAREVYNKYITTESQQKVVKIGSPTDEPLIPVIPYKLYREANVDLTTYLSQTEIPRQRAVAQFPPHDCYYFVNTSAMEPSFMPSDLLALREVRRGTPIINGDPYMLNIAGHGMELRFIYDRGDNLELRAMSLRHEPSLVPKAKIVNLFRIIGLIRTNM